MNQAVDPARLAHHAEEAGDSDAVVTWATRAAERAAELDSHREAVEQYRRVLRHARALGDLQRADLLARLAYECYLTDLSTEAPGGPRGGAARSGPCRGTWPGGGRAPLDVTAALVGGPQRAGRAPRRARRRGVERHGVHELAMAYSNRAQLCMLRGDLAGTRTWSARCFEVLSRLPQSEQATAVSVHALNNLGTTEFSVGNRDEGRR